jgi:hypothetical protein
VRCSRSDRSWSGAHHHAATLERLAVHRLDHAVDVGLVDLDERVVVAQLDLPDPVGRDAALAGDRAHDVALPHAVHLADRHEDPLERARGAHHPARRGEALRHRAGVAARLHPGVAPGLQRRRALALALHEPERGGGDLEAVVLLQQRLEREHLALRHAGGELLAEEGAQPLLVRSRAVGRVGEGERGDHPAGRDHAQLRELARLREGEEPHGHGAEHRVELLARGGDVVEHRERDAALGRAAHHAHALVLGAVAQRAEGVGRLALRALAAHHHRRARRVERVEQAAERGRTRARAHAHVLDRHGLRPLPLGRRHRAADRGARGARSAPRTPRPRASSAR